MNIDGAFGVPVIPTLPNRVKISRELEDNEKEGMQFSGDQIMDLSRYMDQPVALLRNR